MTSIEHHELAESAAGTVYRLVHTDGRGVSEDAAQHGMSRYTGKDHERTALHRLVLE